MHADDGTATTDKTLRHRSSLQVLSLLSVPSAPNSLKRQPNGLRQPKEAALSDSGFFSPNLPRVGHPQFATCLQWHSDLRVDGSDQIGIPW